MKTIVDYAQLVKQQHALNISLAPVEADPTASSKAYAIGQHFILDGELYKAKTAIALGDALVLDTNYEAAGSIEAQIETLDAENQTLTNLVGKKTTAQTLAAGSTSLTFTDSSITTASTIRCFVSKYGIAPTDIVVTAGQAVLTFDAQTSAISVYLMII